MRAMICWCSIVFALVPTLGAQGQERPLNVLLIMIDDLGWADLHCQGNQGLETPNIDRLARQGVRFTDAYAAAPVCSPVRAALLTGKSPARLHITNHLPHQPRFTPKDAVLDPAPMLDHLPLEHVTIAERLRPRGYATGFFGKWHLCGSGRGELGRGLAAYHPEKQGFDVNVGGCALGGPPTFWDPYRIHQIPSRKKGEYLPDRLADEANAFITKNAARPFLLCLWNYTVHWPMEAPKDLVEKYESRVGPGIRDARYAGMIEAMDRSIGRVLGKLDELKIADRTLVIFTSDNGGYSGVADNRPLREGKGYLYEGGIRVPLIIRGPGVKPGRTDATPVITMDLVPTLSEAAGVTIDDAEIEGVSLWPRLRDTAPLAPRALHWHYPAYAWHKSNRLGGAIREGDLKLIERYDDGSLELYDVARDLSETTNLARRRPEDAARLRNSLRSWLKETNAAMPVRR
ncbi:MAG: N-acetylgalactosamine-6-sulfatase [Planctomycetes bacterium]|nr:N-acetylgalactosamine-6-sulfatase [Planctomycetota bacterium]